MKTPAKLALLVVLLAATSWTQAPPPASPPTIDKDAPEVASHETPTTFTTRVNLVTVPVIVRDHKGKAIGTLTREDFQLFDKGKPQVISKFNVEKTEDNVAVAGGKKAGEGGETLDPIPTRFVAFVFDDVHLTTGDLLQSRAAARKYLETSLKPTDRAAVFTTSGKVALDFTHDRQAIDDALVRIAPQPSIVLMALDCPPITYYQADLIVNSNDRQAYTAAYADAVQCSGIDPSLGAASIQAMVTSGAQRSINRAEQDNQVTFSALINIVSRMTTAPGQRLMVLISPGFFITSEFREPETSLMDQAIRSKVVLSTIDARGLYTIIAGGDASTGSISSVGSQATKNRFASENALAQGETLGELAEGTGGTWFHNNNDLVEGLTRVATAPEYEYFLGFSPQNLKFDGKFHELKVVVKGKEFTLQARRGYYAPNHAVTEAEQSKQEIAEAFFSQQEMADIPVVLQTQFFKTTPAMAKLSILAHVDLKQLHFRKDQGRNLETVTIVAGVFDRNGNLKQNGVMKTVDLKFKDENMDAHLGAGLSSKTSFDLQPGRYVIRLVVRDAEGQTMTARSTTVDIP
jgi:VWFA-related protein